MGGQYGHACAAVAYMKRVMLLSLNELADEARMINNFTISREIEIVVNGDTKA